MNAAKYIAKRDEILAVACKLDDFPDDPNTWSSDEKIEAKLLVTRLGALECNLRRMMRSEF